MRERLTDAAKSKVKENINESIKTENLIDSAKSGVKEKAADWVNENYPNWVPAPEVSVEMNKVFQTVVVHFDRPNTKYRYCQGAAWVQAISVASEMRNAFVLGGMGRTFVETETKLIELMMGGPAEPLWNVFDPSAESLGEFFKDKSKEAIDSFKAKSQAKLKEMWSGEPPEVWQTNYSFAGCKSSVNAVLDKARGKYEIMISGDCDCKEVAMEYAPGESARTIKLDNWFVHATGTITPVISGDAMTIVVGQPNFAVAANCECDTPPPPPPPPKEDPVEMIQMGKMRTLSGVRCTACQPLADEVNAYAAEHNRIAERMNELADLIIKEPYKTPERDDNLQTWNDYFKKINRIEQLHNLAFDGFAECERTECSLGDGVLQFDYFSTLPEQWTDCEPCIPLMQAANAVIGQHNKKADELNALARSSSGLRLGTTAGNNAHRNMQRLRGELNDLNRQAQQKIAELSACKAQNCAGNRWEPTIKLSLISTNCPPCQDFVTRYNAIVEEINQLTDKINAIQVKEKAYVLEHGDARGAGMDGLADLREKRGIPCFGDQKGGITATTGRHEF